MARRHDVTLVCRLEPRERPALAALAPGLRAELAWFTVKSGV